MLSGDDRILVSAGFEITKRNHHIGGLGLTVNYVARDRAGKGWFFDVSGAFTTTRGGLIRTDTLWKSLGQASVLATRGLAPVVLLTSHLPRRRSAGDLALRAVGPEGFFDAVEMLCEEGQSHLAHYARGDRHHRLLPGFWTSAEID